MRHYQFPGNPRNARPNNAWLVVTLSASLVLSGVTNNWTSSVAGNVAKAQSGGGVKSTSTLVADARATGEAFPAYEVFEPTVQSVADSPSAQQAVDKGTILTLSQAAASRLLTNKPATLTLPIPSATGKPVQLELVRAEIVTSDFEVITSASKGLPVPVVAGAHYRGVVKGEPNSLAAVSLFPDEVAALYSTEQEGNFVLGKMGVKDADGSHILYSDKDLKEPMPFTCHTKDDGEPYKFEELQEQPAAVISKCIRVYVEADFDLFVDRGSSVVEVVNFVTAFFNQVAVIYGNEGIPIALSSVFVWTTPSPYTGDDSQELLNQFQAFRNAFNGNIGHLIDLKPVGGRAASLNGICNSNIDNRQCVSGIFSFFNNVPAYSWTVDVFSHEMGHLMGSQHTHACAWNGNGTAIDGCGQVAGYPEGNCATGPIPPDGGTIMSYCHLNSVGKNFTKGFGPQPGNVIRSRFALASAPLFGCLTSCTINQPRLQINLTNNTFLDTTGGAVAFVTAPSGGRTVVRITLNPGTTGFSRARFTIIYTSPPSGWTVNIGDSSTNNGGGGDAGTQSNDAEVQVLNTTLTVLGRDATPPPKNLVDVTSFVVATGQSVTFEVSNNFFSWASPNAAGSLSSIFLYALNGQVDTEGAINYDIYAAFNRVISDPSALRTGSGVGLVTVELLP